MVYGFVLIGQAESMVTSSFDEVPSQNHDAADVSQNNDAEVSQNHDAEVSITSNETVTEIYTKGLFVNYAVHFLQLCDPLNPL